MRTRKGSLAGGRFAARRGITHLPEICTVHQKGIHLPSWEADFGTNTTLRRRPRDVKQKVKQEVEYAEPLRAAGLSRQRARRLSSPPIFMGSRNCRCASPGPAAACRLALRGS